MEKTPWTSKPAWIKVCLRNISSLHFPSFPFLSFPLAKNYKINIDSWKIDAKNDIMKNWNQEWMPHSTTFLLALVPVVMELVKLYEATELTDAMYDMGSNYTSQKKKLDKLREFLMSRSKMVPTMTMKGKKTKAEMQNKWGFKFKFNSTKKKKKIKQNTLQGDNIRKGRGKNVEGNWNHGKGSDLRKKGNIKNGRSPLLSPWNNQRGAQDAKSHGFVDSRNPENQWWKIIQSEPSVNFQMISSLIIKKK